MAVEWRSAPEHLSISKDEVHIWRISLDLRNCDVESMKMNLSQMELSRADGFRFELDQRRYIITCGAIRSIISYYIPVGPNELVFCYGQYGKPYLDLPLNEQDVRFNVSHSSSIALCALTRNQDIGVDVEFMSEDIDVLSLGKDFFTPREAAVLEALPEAQRLEAFYNCWTRKEAYLKAVGAGLAFGLDSCEVSLAPGEPPALFRIEDGRQEAMGWTLQSFSPAPGYVAAIAVEGQDWRLKCWDWRGGGCG